MSGELNAEAVQLLRFVRDLTRSRRARVLDVAGYDEVHWLAELPGELRVQLDARGGEVLFGLPPIPLSPPAALEEFDGWLALRRWYRTLRGLAEVPRDRELVLAVGLLTWQAGDGTGVRNHLLATPVRVTVDPATERVDVVLSTRPTSLQDRDLLEDLPGFRPARTDWLRDAVRTGQGAGLQDSVADVLRKWCSFAFDEPIDFREDWTDEQAANGSAAGAPPHAKVRLAPALVLRPHSETALVDYLDGMLAELADGPVPAGLAHFLRPTGEDRLAHLQDRASFGGLLTALLARGQRILVTTPSPTEIRDALPPELAGLAVTVDGDRSDLPERLAALAVRYGSYDPERYDRALGDHADRLHLLEHESSALRARLGGMRHAERLDLGHGYAGTVEEIQAALREGFPWMPVINGLPEQPPLTTAEAAELVGLLATQTAERRARAVQNLPDPSMLPSVEQVRALITVAQVPAPDPAGDLAQRLSDRDPAVIDRLEACANAVGAAMSEMGVDWNTGDWTVRAIADGLGGRSAGWEHVAELASRAAAADRALRTLGNRWVVLPPGEEGELLGAAHELHAYLAGGGTLKRGPLRSAAQKRAEPLLTEATVDGETPVTTELLDAVIAALEGRLAVEELLDGWAKVGVELVEGRPLDGMVAQLAVLYTRLGQVRTALLAVAESANLLRQLGLSVPLRNPAEWQAYRASLETVRIRRRASTAWAALASLRQAIELEVGKGQAPPELSAAAAALSARDLAGYERCLAALGEAHNERAAQARCDQLLARLAEAHPVLAATPMIVPEEWERAWHWAYVSSFLEDRPRTPAEQSIEEHLDQTTAATEDAAASLAAAEAWGWTLSRVHGRPKAEALPVWIMPLAQVATVLPAAKDAFDVIVIDHNDEGADALYLLWMAPRVIVVGEGGEIPPDATVTPDSTLFGALAARFPLLESGVPARQPTLPSSEPEPVPEPRPEPIAIERGRSIVTYQREDLVDLITRLAADDPDLTDDQLLEYAKALLDCPEDEHLIVDARLRYAVDALAREKH
ncbi:hypothetical protein [Actinocorallia longicatena]|uniref:Uncharacterized protein n=1 Tax=Actinocorallia longicatena TaxID=111803 RepID=A0ABP6QMC2_9ACTN